MNNLNTVVFNPTKFIFPSPVTASWAISASWAPSTPSSAAVSASWASQSLSSSYALTTSTLSNFSGSNTCLYLQSTDTNVYPVTLVNDSGIVTLAIDQTPAYGLNTFINIGTVYTNTPSASYVSLTDENGQQWRLSINSSGMITATAL